MAPFGEYSHHPSFSSWKSRSDIPPPLSFSRRADELCLPRLLLRSARWSARFRIGGGTSRQAFSAISAEVSHRGGGEAVERASAVRSTGDENVRNELHASIGK